MVISKKSKKKEFDRQNILLEFYIQYSVQKTSLTPADVCLLAAEARHASTKTQAKTLKSGTVIRPESGTISGRI